MYHAIRPRASTNALPGLQVAFSPTNCSFAQISEDSTIKWNRLHHPIEDSETELKNGK